MVTSWGSHPGKRARFPGEPGRAQQNVRQFNEPAMIAFVYCGTAIVVASFWGTTSTGNISKIMSIQLAQGLVELD